jgi:hypothetical protein
MAMETFYYVSALHSISTMREHKSVVVSPKPFILLEFLFFLLFVYFIFLETKSYTPYGSLFFIRNTCNFVSRYFLNLNYRIDNTLATLSNPIILVHNQKGTHTWNENLCRIEVLTAVVMKNSIFWDISPCSPLKVN